MEPYSKVLKSQIVEFISSYVNNNDTIIGVLRYGAHLPHIYQNACLEIGEQPKPIRLLLSHMIKFFPQEFYQNRNFLILDDTVYEGVVMNDMLNQTVGLGIDRDRIRTATLVAHALSEFEPDCPKPIKKLPDAQYISWKEELAALVRRDIRPTERDHPLYYFDSDNLELGKFLSIIEDYGKVHPVGTDWTAPVFRSSLSIDPSVLSDIAQLEGLELDDLVKIRFYWQKLEKGCRITVAPIVFTNIEIVAFIKESSEKLAALLGLRESFFKCIFDTRPLEMVYYFVSRAVAALLLHRFLTQTTLRLSQNECKLNVIQPEIIDGAVQYVFPQEYIEFYNVVMRRIEEIVSSQPEPALLPFGDRWPLPKCGIVSPPSQRLLPSVYQLLEFITRDYDPAMWDGKRWTPSKAQKGISFNKIVEEFEDPCFVSSALDELLDSGLIRAKDSCLIAENKKHFFREFLSGGEYKALQVSRIADTWRHEVQPYDQSIAEDEALELWGAN